MQLVQTSKTIITADAKPIINELGLLEQKLKTTKEAQDTLTRGTKEMADSKAEVKQLTAEIEAMRNTMGLTGMTVKQLNDTYRQLNKEIKDLTPGTEAYINKSAQLRDVSTRLQEIKQDTTALHTETAKGQTLFGNVKQWITTAFTVGAIIEAGRAMVSFGKDVFEIGSKFEKYEVVLTKAFQSQDKAVKSMNDLQKTAAATPFTLDELTGSYVKLVNRGLTPSMESMTKMGDLAASQGKGFDQLTEAILDAGTGEFERLKEFGISASKSGDQVELSFKGIQKTVKMTPEAMQGAIESFGELDTVAGMMAETMKTGEGQASNFSDKMDALKVMLYQGLSPVFKGLIGYGSQLIDGFIGLVDWTKKLYNANQPLVEIISSIFRTMYNFAGIVWDTIAAVTGMNNASNTAQRILTGLKVALGVVAAAGATLVGVIGLIIDGMRFLSRDISFAELKSNATKNFSEIGKSLKAAFVDDPKKLKGESQKAGEDLGKAHGDGLGAGQKKAQGETHKALSDKEKKHREDEHDKAVKTAEETAKDELEVRKKLADATDKVWFDSIDDQWEKKRLAIIREYEKDWETQKNLVGDKKELQEGFALYEIQLAKNRDAALAKLAKEKKDKEDKEQADADAKMQKALDDLVKGTKAAIADIEKAEKEADKEVEKSKKEKTERIKAMYQSLTSMVNESFSSTIATLESIDSSFAQSQANRIKGIQSGFNQITSAISSMKLDIGSVLSSMKGDGQNAGLGLGESIASGLGAAFTANPVAFVMAGKKLIDGVNSVLEANRWYDFAAPLEKIVADAKKHIDDLNKYLDFTLKNLQEESDRLLEITNANRDQLTAAALDFEAEQFSILVKSKEDLKAVNDSYSAEELRIKELYAAALNSTDKARAEEARVIVDGLIHDLKISRNEELEALIQTENTKRDIQTTALAAITQINKDADAELAELNRTAADRTITEQQALIAAVEANRATELAKVEADRQADLTKLKDYEGQKAEINRLADEALLAAKTNTNNLSIAEQERLITEIEAKRQLDLGNLATSELGIEAIKTKTAAELKIINENAAAETFRIESELKAKQEWAEWQHNLEVYAAQVSAWEAEKKLTIAMLQLQLIKAGGKIFNKSEAKAIEAALQAAYSAMPPMPPSGLFNPPKPPADAGATGGGETKYENGGFFPGYNDTMAKYANGGLAYGPSHSRGGIKLVDSQTGHIRGEMEGGEYIINRRATAANMALLSQINNSGIADRVRSSNFNRTGRPYYEDGGIFSTFGPITLNQSNSKADETLAYMEAIAKATGATAKASEITAMNTDATAKATNAALAPIAEAANNSRQLGSIASATRDTANKNFSPNISIINQGLQQLRDIENSARL